MVSFLKYHTEFSSKQYCIQVGMCSNFTSLARYRIQTTAKAFNKNNYNLFLLSFFSNRRLLKKSQNPFFHQFIKVKLLISTVSIKEET